MTNPIVPNIGCELVECLLSNEEKEGDFSHIFTQTKRKEKNWKVRNEERKRKSANTSRGAFNLQKGKKEREMPNFKRKKKAKKKLGSLEFQRSILKQKGE